MCIWKLNGKCQGKTLCSGSNIVRMMGSCLTNRGRANPFPLLEFSTKTNNISRDWANFASFLEENSAPPAVSLGWAKFLLNSSNNTSHIKRPRLNCVCKRITNFLLGVLHMFAEETNMCLMIQPSIHTHTKKPLSEHYHHDPHRRLLLLGHIFHTAAANSQHQTDEQRCVYDVVRCWCLPLYLLAKKMWYLNWFRFSIDKIHCPGKL